MKDGQGAVMEEEQEAVMKEGTCGGGTGQQVVAEAEVGAAAGRPARRKTLAGGLGGREAR